MSLQITITPKERAAGRFVSRVRRSIQKALAEENVKTGLTQSDIARAIGVNRSVISREIRGHKDLSLSRVAEIAWALGRRPFFDLSQSVIQQGVNNPPPVSVRPPNASTSGSKPPIDITVRATGLAG